MNVIGSRYDEFLFELLECTSLGLIGTVKVSYRFKKSCSSETLQCDKCGKENPERGQIFLNDTTHAYLVIRNPQKRNGGVQEVS